MGLILIPDEGQFPRLLPWQGMGRKSLDRQTLISEKSELLQRSTTAFAGSPGFSFWIAASRLRRSV
jgi:hypothetical protein